MDICSAFSQIIHKDSQRWHLIVPSIVLFQDTQQPLLLPWEALKRERQINITLLKAPESLFHRGSNVCWRLLLASHILLFS